VGRDAEMLSEIHAKPSNIAELKTALPSIWNDLPKEFVDGNRVISKETSMLLQLVDILDTV